MLPRDHTIVTARTVLHPFADTDVGELLAIFQDPMVRRYLTEAATAVCEHAFRERGLPEIAAATDLENEASAQVLLRLGMRQVRTSDAGAGGTAFQVLERMT